MIGLEERLRAELARSAELVRPAPDPMGRLLARRRRRQVRTGVAAVTAAVLALMATAVTGQALTAAGPPTPGPSTTNRAPYNDPGSGEEITSWTRQMLAGPTRGNLAGDTALVADLTGQLAGTQRGSGVDPALDRVKVLLLVDMSGTRVYWAAFYNDTRAEYTEGVGLPGETVSQMLTSGRSGGGGPLGPFLTAAFGVDMPGVGSWHYAGALAPPGCRIAFSDKAQLGPTGTVTRSWVDQGDYIVRAGDGFGGWLRITCAGVVREILADVPLPTPAPFAGAAVTERGHADPALVTRAMVQWRPLPGVKINNYRALWGGTPPGATVPTVVVIGETSGGSALVCALTGTGTHVALAEVIAGGTYGGTDIVPSPASFAEVTTSIAPSAALVAVRLPDPLRPLMLSDHLLVIAPAGATTLHISGGSTQTVPLTDGVGVITVKTPAGLTVRATDGNGRTLAQSTVAEPDADAMIFGQPILHRW